MPETKVIKGHVFKEVEGNARRWAGLHPREGAAPLRCVFSVLGDDQGALRPLSALRTCERFPASDLDEGWSNA